MGCVVLKTNSVEEKNTRYKRKNVQHEGSPQSRQRLDLVSNIRMSRL